MKTKIDFGFDVSVSHDPTDTVVSLDHDPYEATCLFLSLKHLEGTVEALIKARDWCRENADPWFKEYVPDRYQSDVAEREATPTD